MNVLITGGGSTTALSVLKGLRAQREFAIKIIITDTNEASFSSGSHFADQFYTIPPANSPRYLSTLSAICRRERIQLLIPIIDAELLIIARARERFERRGIAVPLPSAAAVRMCNDKYRTYQFFTEHGIPTVQSWLPTNLPPHPRFPLVVKPRGGVSSRDVYQADSPTELQWILRRVQQPIIQALLRGQEYTIDVFADYDRRVISAVPRQRLETKAGISVKGVTTHQPLLISWAVRIAKALGLVGPANIQCFLTERRVRFLEINPRFSGTLPLTIAAGVNSPHLLLKLLANQRLRSRLGKHRSGVVMVRHWDERFTFARP